ncbi:hypothetical protein [Marinobacter nanhaiticus]|uniref:hypothetical protein n=1 Tax=Marinobacter nanhaiticus TaxID=1305740 RepID=UPI000399826C|nr:hypothetical protein [Marinobacter nanhaiticus]
MKGEINDDNAERIGRPFIESIIEAHADADYDRLVELVPDVNGKLTEVEFAEAAVGLEPLGDVVSIEYLAQFEKVKEHLVLWRVKYELAEEDVLWHLYLSGEGDDIKVVGLFFDL